MVFNNSSLTQNPQEEMGNGLFLFDQCLVDESIYDEIGIVITAFVFALDDPQQMYSLMT